jgi:hypothetical protein
MDSDFALIVEAHPIAGSDLNCCAEPAVAEKASYVTYNPRRQNHFFSASRLEPNGSLKFRPLRRVAEDRFLAQRQSSQRILPGTSALAGVVAVRVK